ncbi:MAG: DUF4345 family protein [Alphaproteobacteria bacterium]|nr:DUF4345 family protein [Alphaproteobacteria bacterium]
MAARGPCGPDGDRGRDAASGQGSVEIRAMYGGLELGMGAFLVWCGLDDARARTGLVACLLTLGGLGLARLASWALTAPGPGLHPLLFSVELIGAATAAGVLAWTSRRGDPGERGFP